MVPLSPLIVTPAGDQGAALLPQSRGQLQPPLPNLTQNQGPDHKELTTLRPRRPRGEAGRIRTVATGWRVRNTRCPDSPEVPAPWAPQKSCFEQERAVLRWAEARRLEGPSELGETRTGQGQVGAVKSRLLNLRADPGISELKPRGRTSASGKAAGVLPHLAHTAQLKHQDVVQKTSKTPEGGEEEEGWHGARFPRLGFCLSSQACS